jgi:hypothetical protein
MATANYVRDQRGFTLVRAIAPPGEAGYQGQITGLHGAVKSASAQWPSARRLLTPRKDSHVCSPALLHMQTLIT